MRTQVGMSQGVDELNPVVQLNQDSILASRELETYLGGTSGQ